MQLKVIIEEIQSAYSRGLASNDSRLSSRYIYQKFLNARNRVLSQKKNKKKKISDWNYSEIEVEMIPVNSIETQTLSHMSCTIYRSKEKIPSILTYENGYLLNWIRTLKGKEIPLKSRKELRYSHANKYTSSVFMSFIENSYLYIPSSLSPKKVILRYIIENPLEHLLKECISAKDVDFPIESNIKDSIIKLTVESILTTFSSSREDRINDGREQASILKTEDNGKN